MSKGKKRVYTIRSQPGAPDSYPTNLTVYSENRILHITWNITDDVDYWNSDMGSEWKVKFYFYHHTEKETKLESVYNESFVWKYDKWYWNYGYLEISTSAQNIYGESSKSDNLCFIFPPETLALLVFVNHSVTSLTNASASIWMEGKSVEKFRGNNKYLLVAVFEEYRKEQNNEFKWRLQPKMDYTADSDLYPAHTNTSSGLRVYYKKITFDIDIEEHTNRLMSCNKAFYNDYLRQKIVMNATLHGLQPYKNYSAFVYTCNEMGCRFKYPEKNVFSEFYFTTKEYRPTGAPRNITISIKGAIAEVSWNEIDQKEQNGYILGYNIKLVEMYWHDQISFHNQSQTFFTKTIGKFVQFCIQIAGFTNYPEMGPYSESICNTTEEFAPDITPNVTLVEVKSSSFLFCFKKLPTFEMNGILRYIITKFNISGMEFIESNHTVNQSLYTSNSTQTYCFLLEDLMSFTVYQMQFMFVTIDRGRWSPSLINQTNIGVPAYSPGINTSTTSTTVLISWQKLKYEFWNAPSINYNITLQRLMWGESTLSFVSREESSSYRIEELKPYTEYNISLSACSMKACAPLNFHVIMTNESEPCEPSNIGVFKKLDAGIYINWSSIPKQCENGILIAFAVFIHELDDNGEVIDKRMDVLNDTSVFKYLITGVSYGVLYNISVAGKTNAGIGEKTRFLTLSRGRLVHGGWSKWKEWSLCSETCGIGHRQRKRYCNEPTPVNGKNCSGNATELKECILDPCPGLLLARAGESCRDACQNIGFVCSHELNKENLAEFTSCTVEAGGFFYTEPYHPAYDGQNCYGIHSIPDKINCNASVPGNQKSLQRICNCAEAVEKNLTIWSAWTLCSKKCGFNVAKKRTRQCIGTNDDCKGAKLEQELPCVPNPCPVNGGWSEWSEWSVCNRPCGGGNKTAYRKCDNPEPKYGGENCEEGKDVRVQEECNADECKVHGGWTSWSTFGVCIQPCGNSTKSQFRDCTNPIPEHGGSDCQGNDTIKSICFKPSCPELSFVVELHLDMVFTFHFYYLHSGESRLLAVHLCTEIMSRASNITFIKSCVLIYLKKSSVIAGIELKLKSVEREQLVQLSDVLNELPEIANRTLKTFRMYSHDLPCEPPENITTEVVNRTTVIVSWDLPMCSDKQGVMYVYLAYALNDKVFKDMPWSIVGVAANAKNKFLLTRLQPDLNYKAYMMQARQAGNGAPSKRFTFQTPSFPPSRYPKNMKSISISSTDVFISWNVIDKKDERGVLSGYKIRYRKYHEKVKEEKIVAPTFSATTIERLKPFTLYIFEVMAFNTAGDGPVNSCTEKTLEGVPSIPVPNVRVIDMQSIDWWSVKWGEIPKTYVNGILRGYSLQYYLSYRSDKPVGGEVEKVVKRFDNMTFYYKAVRLLNYATYNVSVTGYTSAGNGPVEEHFARTCKCREHLYGNWYDFPSYTILRQPTPKLPMRSNDELQGIFPSLILKMLTKACGKCKNYDQSQTFYYVTLTGDDPNRMNQFRLKLGINETVDVSFPFYDRINRGVVVPGSVFIPLLRTPGCAFIVRNEVDLNAIMIRLIAAIVNVWPFLIVSYGIATLFGILIWFADQYSNPEEFSLGSAIKGPCIGFWFSFVTMTTVGYGDIAPRSIIARILAIGWCLTGLVLNGIIIGYITTSLTSLEVPQQSSLYNTRVGALNASYELSYAIRRNAILSDVQYLTMGSMLDDLVERKVDVVLVDVYSMVNKSKQIDRRNLKIKAILETETGYGLVLSGFSYMLRHDIESLVYSENEVLSEYTESIKESIPGIWMGEEKSVSELVFGADSKLFQVSAIYMAITWVALAVIGLLVDVVNYIRRRQKVVPIGGGYSCLSEELAGVVETFFDDVSNKITIATDKQEHDISALAIFKENLQRHSKRKAIFNFETLRERVGDRTYKKEKHIIESND